MSESHFEIIDQKGLISGPFRFIDEAYAELKELENAEEFRQVGTLKIVEVHFVQA